MAGTFPQGIPPQFAGGVVQVTSQHIGQCLVEGIRKQFPRQKTQRGDFYVSLTYQLLDDNLSLIKPWDKDKILILMERVMENRLVVEVEGDTRLERFLKARKFKELSKELYVVTKIASDRGKGESLLAQMKRASGATKSNDRDSDPFVDPPSAQLFTTSPTDTLERVEVTTLQSSTTRDAAVHLTLHGRGVPPQRVVATFSPEVFGNDRMDYGALASGAEQDPWASQGVD